MKITKSQLKQIIKEELEKVLSEEEDMISEDRDCRVLVGVYNSMVDYYLDLINDSMPGEDPIRIHAFIMKKKKELDAMGCNYKERQL